MTATRTKQKCICSMWRKKSKEGKSYFDGSTDKETFGTVHYLKGFVNGKKKNPNEPDIRIYAQGDKELGKEVISLWQKKAEKTGVVYFTGKVSKEAPEGYYGELVGKNVVAFVGDHSNEKAPYFKVFLQNERENKKQAVKKEAAKQEDTFDIFEEDLAF